MDPQATLRDLHLNAAQMVGVCIAGVFALVLGFKLAKTVIKLVLLLVALGCLGLGVLWLLGGAGW